MQDWDESSDKVSRIRQDKEKAKSLIKVVELREKNIAKINNDEFVTLIIEDYYEIIKELITAIMSIDGWKTVSHEILIGYLNKFTRNFHMQKFV